MKENLPIRVWLSAQTGEGIRYCSALTERLAGEIERDSMIVFCRRQRAAAQSFLSRFGDRKKSGMRMMGA